MKFYELEDLVVRRLARHLSVTEGDAEYNLIGPRNPQRDIIAAHLKGERITASPDLQAALVDIEAAEAKIRKVRLSNLQPKELRHFEKSLFSELIKSVENRRCQKIRDISKQMDDRRQKNSVEPPMPDATRRLLALEESKLQHSRISESEAMVKLDGFERSGYSRADLLVLGSISDRTGAKAKEVGETIPAHLADSDGVKLVKELERLVSLKPGEIAYTFKGSTAQNVVHIGDLIGDTSPTIQDIAS